MQLCELDFHCIRRIKLFLGIEFDANYYSETIVSRFQQILKKN